MAESFPHLFSPPRVGKYTLKNRIMNTGHAVHFQTGDGTPTEQYVHHVRERAKVEAGIIVTGHTVPVYDDAPRWLSGVTAPYDVRVSTCSRQAAFGGQVPSKRTPDLC